MPAIKKLLSVSLMIFIILQISLIAQDSNTIQDISKDKVDIDQPHGDLSAKDVIENYIEAIGGGAEFEMIKDRTTTMQGQLAGQDLTIVIKQRVPNKLRQDIHSGNLDQSLIYDGSKGISIIGDQQNEIEGEQLDNLRIEAEMNLLLDLEAYEISVELVGKENVDSTECYNIEFTGSSGEKWHQYYSKDSGMKIKETRQLKAPGGLYLQETRFSNYKKVNGLKFPFLIKQTVGAQSLEMNVESIEINTGLADSLFTIRH